VTRKLARLGNEAFYTIVIFGKTAFMRGYWFRGAVFALFDAAILFYAGLITIGFVALAGFAFCIYKWRQSVIRDLGAARQ
jgi:hypothetical protein